jgi:Txe/YoeB family toxin of Txe-Axe toxin-antitoxin module
VKARWPSKRVILGPSKKSQAERPLGFLRKDPYHTPPLYVILVGDLARFCSMRINIQHRVVHQILNDIKTVKVIRLYTLHESYQLSAVRPVGGGIS